MNEKSIEELKAELDALKKANLESEIAKERVKIDAEKKLKEEEKEKILYEEIRQKVISEMDGKSKVASETKETVAENDYQKYFHDPFVKRMGLKGLSYDELMMQLGTRTYGNNKGDSR